MPLFAHAYKKQQIQEWDNIFWDKKLVFIFNFFSIPTILTKFENVIGVMFKLCKH
jgi:hypothetical protein